MKKNTKNYNTKIVNKKIIGFIEYNKIYIEESYDNKAKMSVNISPNSLNSYGIAHGGLIFSLADATMALAAKKRGEEALTLSSEIKFLKAGKGKKLTAIASLEKKYSVTCYCECEVYNDSNELCAIAKGTYCYVKSNIKN